MQDNVTTVASGDTQRGIALHKEEEDSELHATIVECMGTQRNTVPKGKRKE